MSVYSDYKVGAIDEEEFRFLAKRSLGDDHGEYYTDDADDPHWTCHNCTRYDECGCDEEGICDEFEEVED